MVIIKTKEEIEILREGGRRLGFILAEVAKMVRPGVSTKELDDYALKLIRENEDEPAFLNYKPERAPYPYPASLCTSVNDEVVHCEPKKDRILKEGDIVSLDLGLKHKGMFTDHAITVPVGKVNRETAKLLEVTQRALAAGIKAAQPGNTVGDIGYAVEQVVKPYGYGIVHELAGHGVGRKIHEDPYIPNYGKKGTGEKLRPGMVIAIEPMLNLGKADVIFDEKGYTVRTKDGQNSAHFEHTILITDGEPEILTLV